MQRIIFISFVLLLISSSCKAQNQESGKETNEYLNLVLSNSLHPDFTDANKTNLGVSCTFHKDGIFSIQGWAYYASAGHIREPEITGYYKYNSSDKEIELFFHDETIQTGFIKKKKNQTSASFRAMQILSKGGGLSTKKQEDKVINYSSSVIKIIEETENTAVVDLYAFTGKGKKIPLGQTTFTIKNLKEENKSEHLNMILSNSLHSDFTDYNKMNAGINCTFHPDNTFVIQPWWYGVSSGLRNRQAISGSYKYNPTTKEIILIFDKEIEVTKNDKQYPVSYYAMQKLAQEGKISFSPPEEEDNVIEYASSHIKIIDEVGNKVVVDLYAFTSDGTKIPLGQTTFTIKNLKEE